MNENSEDSMLPVQRNRVVKMAAQTFAMAVLGLILVFGCQPPASPVDGNGSSVETSEKSDADSIEEPATQKGSSPPPAIVSFVSVPQLSKDIALVESVFWEPEDTRSLRELISTDQGLKDASVLEIGTGSGLISLCCLQAGARRALATDINPKAVKNAQLNGREMGFADRLEVRLVPRRDPGAWTVIRPEERFDFIISNPPWEDAKPKAVEEFALYDPDFELLDSLLSGARSHLNPGGRMWLAYGCVTAIRRIQEQAGKNKLDCRILDERALDALPEVFLPGMLIEITVPFGFE